MKHILAMLVAVLILGGCTVSNVATQGFSTIPESSRVVVMPPDIKYYRVTASGISEPAPDWTETARSSFDSAFTSFVEQSGLNVSLAEQDAMGETAVEYEKLHSAVGNTILRNHFSATRLPSKLDPETRNYAFDWSLGEGVADLAPDGDYALFVFYRDYQASGGRVGMAVFAAVLGVGIYTGHQGGFASLVDLNTGKVVWFNNVPVATGNMRAEQGARSIVERLFASLNQAKS